MGTFWRFWGSGVRGFKKLRFLLQKARPCVKPRHLSHFASKSVEGCDLQVLWGKKTEKVTDSHRKDMSPLTQGLNCRSACDFIIIGRYLIWCDQYFSTRFPVYRLLPEGFKLGFKLPFLLRGEIKFNVRF